MEGIGLPVGLRLTPVTGVSGEAERNLMMTNVLRALIRITAAGARRADERETNRLVIRFVRGVLAVSQNGCPEAPGLVSKIDPLMGSDFELPLCLVRTLDRADVPIVSGQMVGGAQRKGRFQIRFFRFPVDHIAEFDAIAGVTGGQTDSLNESGTFGLAVDFDTDPDVALFDDANPGVAGNKAARRALLVFEIHVPCRPAARIVGRDGQTDWLGKKFAGKALCKDGRDVTVPVNRYPVPRIFERRFADLQFRRRRTHSALHVIHGETD